MKVLLTRIVTTLIVFVVPVAIFWIVVIPLTEFLRPMCESFRLTEWSKPCGYTTLTFVLMNLALMVICLPTIWKATNVKKKG